MTTAVGRSIPPQRLINLMNPLVRSVLQSPLHGELDGTLLVLHLTGRKSGRRFDIPVSYVDFDGRLIVVTQHKWRVNVRGHRYRGDSPRPAPDDALRPRRGAGFGGKYAP
jgi:hypothetical protein